MREIPQHGWFGGTLSAWRQIRGPGRQLGSLRLGREAFAPVRACPGGQAHTPRQRMFPQPKQGPTLSQGISSTDRPMGTLALNAQATPPLHAQVTLLYEGIGDDLPEPLPLPPAPPSPSSGPRPGGPLQDWVRQSFVNSRRPARRESVGTGDCPPPAVPPPPSAAEPPAAAEGSPPPDGPPAPASPNDLAADGEDGDAGEEAAPPPTTTPDGSLAGEEDDEAAATAAAAAAEEAADYDDEGSEAGKGEPEVADCQVDGAEDEAEEGGGLEPGEEIPVDQVPEVSGEPPEVPSAEDSAAAADTAAPSGAGAAAAPQPAAETAKPRLMPAPPQQRRSPPAGPAKLYNPPPLPMPPARRALAADPGPVAPAKEQSPAPEGEEWDDIPVEWDDIPAAGEDEAAAAAAAGELDQEWDEIP